MVDPITPPSNIGFGTVVWQVADWQTDSADGGDIPDFNALTGTVTFTPTVLFVNDATADPNPLTLAGDVITGTLGPDGYLGVLNGSTFTAGVKLPATNDPDTNPTDFAYRVDFTLRNSANKQVRLPSFNIAVPEGETVDLALTLTPPSAEPESLAAAEAIAAIAAQAALDAEAAAEAAEESAANADRLGWTMVTASTFGAVGDGVTSDTAAIQAAINATPTRGTVYFPPTANGYLVDGALTVPSYLTLRGAGKSSRIINAVSGGTMVTLTNKREVKFEHLWVHSTPATTTQFDLSNSFRCEWSSVYMDGEFVGPKSPATITGQIGVKLRDNSGDNDFYGCDITNFHVGIWTSCIQNGFHGGKLGTNNYSVYGTGGGGMAFTGYTDFVAGFAVDGVTPLTENHVWIDGATGQWWFNETWFEGCDKAIVVGNASSGPAQFHLSASKLAATSKVIEFNYCRNPMLFNVEFAGDRAGAATPTPITVNSTNVPTGVAFLDSQTTAVDLTQFPTGWTVHNHTGSTASLQFPDLTRMKYGSIFSMERSDNAQISVLQMVSGPTLNVRGPNSNGVPLRLIDSSGATIHEFDSVTSRVNYLGEKPAVTGAGPSLEARGTDTNVDLVLVPKGSGIVRVGSTSGPKVQDQSEKAQANGYASLDSGGKIPASQLPSSVMDYKGVWNASTNTPTLADGSGDTGDVYRVSVGGTRNLGSGSVTYDVGDLVIYDGTVWQRSDSTDAVSSVAGLTGTVSASGLKTALSLPTNAASDITANATAISDHLADTTDAHDASAISVVPTGTISATDVQAALAELDTEKAAITATITNGDTTHAPNGDAVFDALALKPDLTNTPTVPTFALASGTYITPLSQAQTGTTTNQTLRVAPWFCPQALTITRIGAEVTSAGEAGSKVRLGIYADDGTGKVGNLVVDAGQINGDSATVQEITLGASVVLNRGWYWVGGVVQSAPTTQPTLRITALPTPPPGFLLSHGTSILTAGLQTFGYSQTGVTGALPSTGASLTGAGSSGFVRLFFKLA